MIKRILATVMCLGIFLTVSCAEAPQLLNFIQAEEGADLDGTVIDFAWCEGNAEHPFYIEDTPQYDAFRKRISDTNEALNCEIKVEIDADQTPIEVAIQSGSDSVDILLCSGIYGYMDTNMLHSLNDYPEYIDLNDTKKYGTKNFLEGMMYNGVVYGVSPVQWPGFESNGGYLTFYNRDLFQEYNIPDFREYYENEKWTWDTFRYEYMDKYDLQKTDGSTLYLLHTNFSDLYQIVFYSNGLNYIKANDDGSLSVDPFTNEFTSSMQYWHDLVQENKHKIEYDTNTYSFTPYTNEDAAVGFGWNSHVVTGCIAYNDKSFETGVLPIPCGPDVEYGQWGQCIQRAYGMVLPITSTIPEASAQAIDMLFEPFEEFGGDDGLFEYYRTNVFTTDFDAQIYLDVLNYIRYDYTFEGDRYQRNVTYSYEDYFLSSTVTLAMAMEQSRPLIDRLTSEFMLGNYEAVYGE
ncbi:MAG: extracellular solute-binding protein [Clostridia bacterium]|nr:extracellular solute-binding protein [Clostridia bacterium]